MKLQQRQAKLHYSKRSILKFLGLPFVTRWEHAEPVLKDRLTMARRSGDDERAKMFSGIKAFLKRNLKRSCAACGVAIMGGARYCYTHRRLGFPSAILAGLILVVPGLQAGVLRTNVTLVWSYPTNSYTITNGTEIVTFTNDVDRFVIYSSDNIAINATNWPVLTTVSGTNRSVTLPLTPQMRFFVITASNYWGETGFSNVAWTPPPPSDEGTLGLK